MSFPSTLLFKTTGPSDEVNELSGRLYLPVPSVSIRSKKRLKIQSTQSSLVDSFGRIKVSGNHDFLIGYEKEKFYAYLNPQRPR